MRLDASALRAVRSAMRQDEDYAFTILSSPVLSGVLQSTEKTLMVAYENDFRFLLFRYIHLRLIQAVVVLLRNDPGCGVVMIFPRSGTIGFTASLDEGHIVFNAETTARNGQIVKESSYWDERGLVGDVAQVLLDRFPRYIEVQRCPQLGVAGKVSAHAFVRAVEDVWGRLPSHRRWFGTYNRAHLHAFVAH